MTWPDPGLTVDLCDVQLGRGQVVAVAEEARVGCGVLYDMHDIAEGVDAAHLVHPGLLPLFTEQQRYGAAGPGRSASSDCSSGHF